MSSEGGRAARGSGMKGWTCPYLTWPRPLKIRPSKPTGPASVLSLSGSLVLSLSSHNKPPLSSSLTLFSFGGRPACARATHLPRVTHRTPRQTAARFTLAPRRNALVGGTVVTHLCRRDAYCAQCCVGRTSSRGLGLYFGSLFSTPSALSPAEGADDIRPLPSHPPTACVAFGLPNAPPSMRPCSGDVAQWLAQRPVLLSARGVSFTHVHPLDARRLDPSLSWSNAPSCSLCRREEALLP